MAIINVWHRLSDSSAITRVSKKAGIYELGNKNKAIIYIGRAEGDRLRERKRNR